MFIIYFFPVFYLQANCTRNMDSLYFNAHAPLHSADGESKRIWPRVVTTALTAKEDKKEEEEEEEGFRRGPVVPMDVSDSPLRGPMQKHKVPKETSKSN